MRYQEYLLPRLGDASRFVRFIFEPRNDSVALLSDDAIRDMFAVADTVRAVSITEGGQRYGLSDVCRQTAAGAAHCSGIHCCVHRSGACARQSSTIVSARRFTQTASFAKSSRALPHCRAALTT